MRETACTPTPGTSRITDRQTDTNQSCCPAHTASYTQLVAENKVISITCRGYDKNLQKWIVTHLCYLNYECETNTKWYIIHCTSINGGPTDLHLNSISLSGLWILLSKRGIASGKFVHKMYFVMLWAPQLPFTSIVLVATEISRYLKLLDEIQVNWSSNKVDSSQNNDSNFCVLVVS